MWIKLIGIALSTNLGRLSVFEWYFQLDYKDLKLIMSSDNERRRDAKKKHKAS